MDCVCYNAKEVAQGMEMKKLLVLALVAVSAFSAAQTAYTVRTGSNELCTVDLSNNSVTTIGNMGVGFDFGDLAYDSSNNTMYMVDGWGDMGGSHISNLYSVNLTTGVASLIGSTGVGSLFSIAFDSTTGNLYAGQSTGGSNLYRLDRNTGAASLVGASSSNMDGLTVVGSTGDLVGMFAGPGTLHRIDRNTGGDTLLAGSGFIDNGGIAWDAGSNSIFAVDWGGSVYKFDVANAYTRTTLGNLGSSFDGLAFATPVPEPATMAALGLGVAAVLRRRRKSG